MTRLRNRAPLSGRGALAVALVGTACALAATTPVATAQTTPDKTRVYVVVLDGLRPDEVALMPFLSSLAADGTFYQQARAVMVAETIPNHVAMVTGVYPDRSGIVANDFPAVPGGTKAEAGAGDEAVGAGDPRLLQADSMFTLIQRQCPQLVASSVMSKDYLFTVMDHDRTGDGKPDADSNFDNTSDPSFIPIAGLTPDERTIVEATRVSQELDPDFLFVNLGAIDRMGHADAAGGVTGVLTDLVNPVVDGIPQEPPARAVQRSNTDSYLRTFVEQLKADGRWEDTALVVTADHSMDWSLPTDSVTIYPDFEADPLLAGQVLVAQNGGASLYSLRDRDAPQAAARLSRMREIALATDGVDEALYRLPNALDGGTEHWVGAVHPDWHQTHPRSGDLLVTVQDTRRSSEPGTMSNPLPGNHGMPSTLRIPMVVGGGIGVVPSSVDGSTDPSTRAADQAENVDLAPTAAWLLGVDPPAGGFDGRVLSEAFTARPAPTCVGAVSSSPTPTASTGTGTGTGSGADADGGAADGRAGDGLAATGPAGAGAVAVLALLLVGAGLVVRRQH